MTARSLNITSSPLNTERIQISIDRELLARIDSDPEVVATGRSEFIQSAVCFYLRAKRASELDHRIRQAYTGEKDAMLAEIEDLLNPAQK